MAKRKKSFLYNENLIWERRAVAVGRRDNKAKERKSRQKSLKTKKNTRFRRYLYAPFACAWVVPKAGLEPARCRHHRILSPARLPIPPLRHLIWVGNFVIALLYQHTIWAFAIKKIKNNGKYSKKSGFMKKDIVQQICKDK